LFKPGAGGILLGSTSCGAVLHVPTHIFVDGLLANPVSSNINKNITVAATVENEWRKDWKPLKKVE
jgi:hypothetical protein